MLSNFLLGMLYVAILTDVVVIALIFEYLDTAYTLKFESTFYRSMCQQVYASVQGLHVSPWLRSPRAPADLAGMCEAQSWQTTNTEAPTTA